MTFRRVRRAFLGTGALAAFLLVVTAAPAGAHGLGGLKPTNYTTVLQSVRPHVAGLHLRVTDLGTKLELTNRGDTEVTVLGYDDEPYLRVGPKGVFENVRSPAVFLNRSATITTSPPKRADSSAAPEWRKVSSTPTVRWHDHRAHFMGNDDPPVVERAPGEPHVVEDWTIPMRAGATAVVVRGQVLYEPPPSPWPWVIGAVALAAAVVALSRTRGWKTVFVVTLALLTAAEVVHVFGLWDASTASFGTKLGESAYSLAGIALGLVGLGWMWRKGVDSAVPLVLVAAIFLVIAGGFSDVTSLSNALVPSTLPADLARLLVALNLGLGCGLAVAAALRLRPSTASGRPPARSRPTRPARQQPRPEAPVTS